MAHAHDGGQRKDMLKHNLKACSIDQKELKTLAEGQIIVACDVQSFGATIRVRTSHRAEEEEIPT